MTPKIAFLGMGAMGRAMTKNLVKNGKLDEPLILWNRTHIRAVEHSEQIRNSAAIESLEDAVSTADIVWSCLSTEKVVIELFDTILQQDVRGKLFVESSSITPEATNSLAARVGNAGAEFVGMPVFGDAGLANAAILTCVPAGLKDSVDKVLPFLKGVIARSVINLSDEQPGSASHLKMIGNVMIMQMIELTAEAHVLAEKTGLKNELLHQAISTIFPGSCAMYSGKMISGEYHRQPLAQIDPARAIAASILDLAKTSGASLKGYDIASKHLDAVRSHVGEGGNISGIYGAVRLESGLLYEN
ncbi:6-phosphogluconate dehydrogenase-like protein [Lophiotrema nucula]|uniref:6-phosphogluconate dehydrogenase-like protein n=1 Tax=Lophiotrema nucula TaxID=690887 RepID=A0A6A5YLX7_9PLEO|nr:6-phosphogluconate dehydrogenase-like protein [Lophiotrema nucula]